MHNEKLITFMTGLVVGAHESIKQKRKYTNEPYYTHPLRVYEIVQEADKCDIIMMLAALGHDLIEDTGVTKELIEELFCKEVADMIDGLSDVSKPEDGNRAVRKQKDLEHISKQSADCKTVKLADLIDNTSSILQHDKEFARVYLREKLLLLEVLKEGDKGLWNKAYKIVTDGLIELGETL